MSVSLIRSASVRVTFRYAIPLLFQDWSRAHCNAHACKRSHGGTIVAKARADVSSQTEVLREPGCYPGVDEGAEPAIYAVLLLGVHQQCVPRANVQCRRVVFRDIEIFPNNPIHWNEKFRISATNHGCVPGSFVDSVTNTLPIKRGETFVFQSFEDLDVVRSQADKSKTAISFQAKVGGCSIILSQGIDLYRAEEDSDFTHMFIASNGTLPFPFPTDDSIETTRTMLIFFTPKSNLLIRGMAFDRSSVAMEPLVFNYGKAESHFTEVTLDFVDGRPQILTPIKVFEDESC